MFRNIQSSFGVISIAGMCRTGKSYLLNKMLLNRAKESKGFVVGKTVNACTKGLWIYSKPIIGKNEKGETIPVFIVDTEGFGSIEEDINHDIRIFALSVLLSSCFIYNSIGSIDENSIESLSFVANLTDFMQMNAESEAVSLFPKFLWILRDFSLQLQDETSQITAKEYLENILNSDKNSQIKQKIKNYFVDRDCYPIVRPVTDEKDLQNLDEIPDEKLRTEFIEQVITLRKRILNQCPPKLFHNREINGEQFITVIKSYLEMLNCGNIPNIESIWVSLSKSETYKAIEAAEKEYDKVFKDNILKNGFKYFPYEDLQRTHKEAKEGSYSVFKAKSIGDGKFIEELTQEMKKKIKERFAYFKNLNDEEIKNELYKFLKKRFENIEIKIKTHDVKSISELEVYLCNIEKEVCESLPESNMRNEMLLDFKVRILLFASSFYLSTLENHYEGSLEEKNQQVEKLKAEVSEVRDNFEREAKKKDQALSDIKSENFALKKEIEILKEKFAIEETEKDQRMSLLNENLSTLKKEYAMNIDDLKNKISIMEEEKIQAERKYIKLQANYDKEKALTDQKMDHLNKLVEEHSKKEKSSGQDLKSQLKEQANALREANSKYEKVLKDLNAQTDKLKEKVVDLESSISNKDNLLEIERIKSDELQLKTRTERESLNEKLNVLKKKVDEEREKCNLEIDAKEKQLKSVLAQWKLKEEEFTSKMKTLDEECQNKVNKIEREYLILKQNNEFLELKCTDLNNQLIEQKKNQERIIQALESKLNDNESIHLADWNNKISEIKVYYENEKKQHEASYEREKATLAKEIENLQQTMNLRSSGEMGDQKVKNELKNEISRLLKQNELLLNEKRQLEEFNRESQKDCFLKIKQLNEELDKHLEEKEKIYQNEIRNLNQNSEEAINQFKSLFEIEKMRLEEKLKEEKIKNENKMKVVTEENENKLKEMEKELKTELEELQEEYNLLESDHQNYIYNAEHEVSLLNQKIETLESALKESKENVTNLQSQFNQTLESKTEAFNMERKELLKKVEEIRNECNAKEKELTALNMKKEALEKTIYDNEQTYNKQRKELEEDVKEMITKHENFKVKQQEIIDELLIKKLEFSRETALLKQQIEFLNTKIEDQNKINDENQKEYEESLYTLKMELIREFNVRLDQSQREKEDIMDKLNKKKKELRDLEQTFLKQTCMVEKEKNVLNDKIQALGNKKKEMSENYQLEFDKVTKEMNNMKAEYYSEIEEQRKANDELKKKLREVVNSQNEKDQLYENEKSLMDNKVKLLEKQKEEYKKELNETNTKMEKVLEVIQKKNLSDRGQIESVFQDKLIEMEKQYQQYIKEVEENHQNVYAEMVMQNQELENELKKLSLQAELRNKSITDPNAVNKKISDLIDVQEKLKRELEEVRREKDKKSNESQIAEKERDLLKLKITDSEARCKEAETKRGFIVLEYEKEKARWSLEKDHLTSNIYELQETVERLQKKVEILLKDDKSFDYEFSKNPQKLYDKDTYLPLPGRKKSNTNTNTNNNFTSNNISTNLICSNLSSITNNWDKHDLLSPEYNKPRIYNPNSNHKSSLQNSKNYHNDTSANDKFDAIYNNLKLGMKSSVTSSVSKNINKK